MAIEDSAAVAPKVRLADIVGCVERSPSVATLGRITQKHLDFVLIDASSSRIVAAIELDDASHGRPSVIRRDTFVNELMAQAGVPLLRVPAAARYDIRGLQSQIHRLISLHGSHRFLHPRRDGPRRRKKFNRGSHHVRARMSRCPTDDGAKRGGGTGNQTLAVAGCKEA